MKALLLLVFVTITSYAWLQKALPSNVNPCGTYEKMKDMEKDPEFKKKLDYALQNAKEKPQQPSPKGIVYQIPIVFHILHDGGPSNISREQVLDGLAILNEDFRGLNADINDVAPVFQGLQADVEVEFVLATKAPDGSCFSGITRTYNPVVAFDGNMDQVQAIRDGNDVYNGDWPGNKYLNVFVVGSLTEPGSQLITLGYTTYPAWGGLTMENGFHVIHECIGSIGTGGIYGTSTSTHEIGHWLNLAHTWGSNNDPGVGNCGNNDNVDDTPSCLGIQGGPCVATNPNPLNSCSNDNAFWGFDIQDNVENYMDYAHCDKMFTWGQAQRMRDALTNSDPSSNGGRNNLWTAQNLQETGADGNVFLCNADFSSDKKTICAGEQIQFHDDSYNIVSGWNWSFPGGTPASSSAQHPLITYSTPGLYEVTLMATDGSNNMTETKTAYIRVLPDGGSLPFLESFENYTTLSNIPEWEIYNEDGTQFELATNVGHTGTQCAKLANLNQEQGWVDELIALPLDLSSVSQVTMSFRYAYKRKNNNSDDWFRVLVNNSCTDSWVIRKTIHGSQISSNNQGTAYTPSTQDEWVTVHMTNITSAYWVDNFRYKFRFESGGGNNFYLDNINIYEGAPSDDLVSGLTEEGSLNEMSIYPNPTEGELTVDFELSHAQNLELRIVDLTGKILQKNAISANEGKNSVYIDTELFAHGMYLLQIEGNGISTNQSFVVK